MEAENDQAHEYGEERMLPVVQALQNATANETLKRMMSSVDAFVGSRANTTISPVWFCG